MEHFWEILNGIPWWVYVLFVVLIRLGIQSLEPRTVTSQRLILFPLVFLILSLMRLYQNASLGFPSLIFWWVICLALGAYLGAKEVSSWKIHVDKKKKTITIPGNYSTIVLIFSIFILNFFWGYYYSVATNISYGVYLADTITTTICTGFFVGRGWFFLKSYYKKS